MTSFIAHLKMSASKRKAKQKLAQMEREAEVQDAESEGDDNGKLRKREVKWEQDYWN
jgi:hypothetical protein